MLKKGEKIDKEIIDVGIQQSDLIEVYKVQWLDIHHNRSQDWETAKIILGGFLGVSGIKVFTEDSLLTITVSSIFVIICLFGMLVAIRHKRLLKEKMAAVRKLEAMMKIDTLQLFIPRKGKILSKTQNLLIIFYSFWAFLFICFAIIEAFNC